ncbi:hypothetical protein QFZ44_000648 [Pantoea agglomerans]|uniref:hypothetical protein n=1 Tax=Enterobacter agglomerans TaxID=549 RepID=UPI00278AD8C1|nr:hypothetical protein [Pantoea agglomerans]MDQ0628072.1 hypothetical protein [Pantoea agglomerans]
MPNSLIQPSFAGGEIAPNVYGRVDLAKYAVALRRCRNFIVRQYGGIENRPGTRFIAEAKYPGRKCRLIPFQFSTVQTYALEFGHGYMRVFKDGGQVMTSGNAVYEISTPYAEADLFDLKFTQSADVMTICHKNYAPRELQRYAHDNWALVEVVTKNGPFEDINVDESKTVYASGETGNIILTASAAIFTPEQVGKLFYLEQPSTDSVSVWETSKTVTVGLIRRADSNYYRANTAGKTGTLRPSHTEGMAWDGWGGDGDDDTGVQWEYLHSGNGLCRVTGVAANGLTANATVLSRIPSNVVGSGKSSYKWARYAWNSVNGYPGTVVYYQQRLFFAASTAYPQTIWASRSGDYKDFGKSSPIADDDRITYTYAGRQVNEIRHLIDVGSLVALTSGGQFQIKGDQNNVLTPSSFSFSSQGSDGASSTPPITVSNIALFIQEKGSVVRDLAYSFDVDGYQGSDLTVLANHLFQGYQLVDWSFTVVPYSAAWAIRNDGMLLTLTYLRDQQVFAWSPQPSDGKFESTCSISEGTEDGVYFSVQRTVNGQVKRYIERLSSRQFTDDVDAFFVDCGLSYDGRNTDPSRLMTIASASGDWGWGGPFTVSVSGSTYFTASNVGDEIHFPYSESEDGEVIDKTIRLTIIEFNNGNQITAQASRDIPNILQSVATSSWRFARKAFSGLQHLEGKTVSILADANVETQKNVSGGVIKLDSPGAVVHVGLPITAEFETLDINIANQETLLDKKMIIAQVSLLVNASRGVFAGTDGKNMYEYAQREYEFYDRPVDDATGTIDIDIDANWGKGGRIYVKQSDPLPLSILAVIPSITVGGR